MTVREAEEILEIIWMKKEEGKRDLCVVEDEIKSEKLQNLLEEMQKDGLVMVADAQVSFTDKGEREAAALIRRHRLAERLLVDVLDTREDSIEEPACQFEHLVSEEVTEAICTLLGHPKVCPHGLPIPEGKCCATARKEIKSLIVSLDKVEVGEWVRVSYIMARHHPRLHKLMSFGVAPGVKIKLHQKSPAYVIQVEETQIALEKEIISDIFVRRR